YAVSCALTVTTVSAVNRIVVKIFFIFIWVYLLSLLSGEKCLASYGVFIIISGLLRRSAPRNDEATEARRKPIQRIRAQP
ncbi:MAG: hypothetical protein LBP63_04495, partial [Prevotellaceae bacterium]|nr:hypothetical protein [Prevotellaceae bacterium]